jgi:hypothetical protein
MNQHDKELVAELKSKGYRVTTPQNFKEILKQSFKELWIARAIKYVFKSVKKVFEGEENE